MPEIGVGGGGGSPSRPKPPPRVVLPNPDNQPPPATRVVQPNPDNQGGPKPASTPPVRPPSRPPSIPARSAHTHAPPNPHVLAAAKEALLAVFHLQPLKVQGELARAAAIHPSPVGDILVNDVKNRYLNAVEHHQKFPNFLAGTGPSVGSVNSTSFEDFANEVAGLFKGIRQSTTPASAQGIGAIEGGNLQDKFATNAAKDLVGLPASTISSLGVIGGDVASGHFGQAAKDLYGPFVSLVEHPGQTVLQHPLDTALMVAGGIHGASRLAAGPLRALAPEGSATARALATEREPIHLTANLEEPRPPFSKSPTVKALQAAPEAARTERNDLGELVYRKSGPRERAIGRAVGQERSFHEAVRRANRDTILKTREGDITPSRAARAAHVVKTALKYNPDRATIPGAAALARIADHTIRRPDTFLADLEKHVNTVTAAGSELPDDTQMVKAHDAYVKSLRQVMKDPALKDPKNVGALFKAATNYARGYAVTEAEAHRLGLYGHLSTEQLERAAIAKYAIAHMGARYHPEDEALVVPGKFGERQLTNAEIKAHMNGPQGSRRPIAFVTDRVRYDAEDRSKPRTTRHVSEERRPIPDTTRNTYYAYQHGLTDASHHALTEQHVLLQGLVDATKAQNNWTHLLAVMRKRDDGSYGTWQTFKEAAAAGRKRGLVPFKIAEPFHPQDALAKSLQEGHVDPATVEEEAVRRSMNFQDRLHDDGSTGRWALIDPHAAKVMQQFSESIPKNPVLRLIRGANNQFRTVALSLSAKHLPGVAQENLIRDAAYGVGFRSWFTGGRALKRMAELDPEAARLARLRMVGRGQMAGMTEAAKSYGTSDLYRGTQIHGPLKAMEMFFKAPGGRQMRVAWRAYSGFVIKETKRLLEEQHLRAGVGKQLLAEHGYAEAAQVNGFMGVAQRMLSLYGSILDDAAKGLLDPAKQRAFVAGNERMYGKWTGLSPSGQMVVMYSPFGQWWVNSARFLARMPIDMPVKTGILAAANAGTQKERRKLGLDMFAKGALPLFMQGAAPLGGGKVLAQNYYSPFGIANDPMETAQSLFEPWATPIVLGLLGDNWLGKPLTSPGNPKGYKQASPAERGQYILDSLLASFVPFYEKAQTVAAGGASQYDVSGNQLLPSILRGKAPATKTKGKGVLAGLGKAFNPLREYGEKTPPKSTGAGNGLSNGTISQGGGLSNGGITSGGLSNG